MAFGSPVRPSFHLHQRGHCNPVGCSGGRPARPVRAGADARSVAARLSPRRVNLYKAVLRPRQFRAPPVADRRIAASGVRRGRRHRGDSRHLAAGDDLSVLAMVPLYPPELWHRPGLSPRRRRDRRERTPRPRDFLPGAAMGHPAPRPSGAGNISGPGIVAPAGVC